MPVSNSTARVSGFLLIGVMLFASGLGVVAGGLGDFEGSAPIGTATARSGWIAAHDHVSHGSLPETGGSAKVSTAPAAPDDPPSEPAARRPQRSFSVNSLGNLDGVAMERAAARWSADWYLATLANGGTRGYLARSANAQRVARWYRSLTGWEDLTGYHTVEVSRGTREKVPDVSLTVPIDSSSTLGFGTGAGHSWADR